MLRHNHIGHPRLGGAGSYSRESSFRQPGALRHLRGKVHRRRLALAAIGTFALAGITIWQNRQIERKNRELNAARDAWEKSNTKRPFFAIDEVVYGAVIEPSSGGDYRYEVPGGRRSLGPNVTLKNIGDGPALNVRVTPESAFGDVPEELRSRMTCLPGKTLKCKLTVHAQEAADIPGFHEAARIEYENLLGQAYRQTFEFSVRERAGRYPHVEHPSPCDPSDSGMNDFCYEVVMKQISHQHVAESEETSSASNH